MNIAFDKVCIYLFRAHVIFLRPQALEHILLGVDGRLDCQPFKTRHLLVSINFFSVGSISRLLSFVLELCDRCIYFTKFFAFCSNTLDQFINLIIQLLYSFFFVLCKRFGYLDIYQTENLRAPTVALDYIKKVIDLSATEEDHTEVSLFQVQRQMR